MVDSLDQPKDGIKTRGNKEEIDTIGFHARVRTDSPIKANGISSVSLLDSISSTVPTLSLSLIESSTISPVQPTLDDIIAFGGIPKSSVAVRSSSRLESMPNVDMPQMEKAKKATQMRQTPAGLGKSVIPKFSIVNNPDDEIGHRAERLGISLGCSEREVEKSIKGIKLLEENRILTLLHNNSHDKVSEEEGLSSLVMSKVSTLCEDLVDEDDIPLGVDDDIEPLKPIVRGRKTRQKKVYDTNNI
jgi:hypothetical protein